MKWRSRERIQNIAWRENRHKQMFKLQLCNRGLLVRFILTSKRPIIYFYFISVCSGLNCVIPNQNPNLSVTVYRGGRKSRGIRTHKKCHLRTTNKKVATCKARKKVSGETQPANTLVLHFQLSELWEINFYCLSYLVCVSNGSPSQLLYDLNKSQVKVISGHSNSGR